MAKVDVALDTARFRRAILGQPCLSQLGHQISLGFMPYGCPQLELMERPRRVTHRRLTRNKCRRDYSTFAKVVLSALSQDINNQVELVRHVLTEDFRAIDLNDYWLVA